MSEQVLANGENDGDDTETQKAKGVAEFQLGSEDDEVRRGQRKKRKAEVWSTTFNCPKPHWQMAGCRCVDLTHPATGS